jgi:hypothetical protein
LTRNLKKAKQEWTGTAEQREGDVSLSLAQPDPVLGEVWIYQPFFDAISAFRHRLNQRTGTDGVKGGDDNDGFLTIECGLEAERTEREIVSAHRTSHVAVSISHAFQ